MADVEFKISSGLKSIIGRDLITNDFVAIFELVKNSFDAQAKKVKVVFDLDEKETAAIYIIDSGKGMSAADIRNKWLFVAYSAKKSGEEDKGPRRIYAGSKGVGRFSCDRLGQFLNLQTKAKSEPTVNHINVDWGEFEKYPKLEFNNVKVAYFQKEAFELPATLFKTDSAQGTVLKITGLREYESWTREKLLRLKRSLQKLLDPFVGSNNSRELELICAREIGRDDKIGIPELMINGVIENNVFDKFSKSSTVIRVSLHDAVAETELIDRGAEIYKTTEDIGESYPELSSCRVTCDIAYLNTASKALFKRTMGVPSVEYGSLFLVHNGFRVYPIGDEIDDFWGLNRRKQQGYSKYLGTREIFGCVRVNDGGSVFQESSNREGLVFSPAVEALQGFVVAVVRRLEAYVTRVTWKDPDDNDNLTPKDLGKSETRARIIKLVRDMAASSRVKIISYNKDLISLLNARAGEYGMSLADLRVVAEKTGNRTLLCKVDNAEEKYKGLQKKLHEQQQQTQDEQSARQKAESSAAQARQDARRQKAALDEERKRTLLLLTDAPRDKKFLESFMHQILKYASQGKQKINNYLRFGEKPDAKTDKLCSELLYLIEKIYSASHFATMAEFRLNAEYVTEDLPQFIAQYAKEVCMGFDGSMTIDSVLPKRDFVIRFNPMEMGLIIENLASNSRKAHASRMTIKMEVVMGGKDLKVVFADNGDGLAPEVPAERIFEKGFSRTNGSGLGLYTCKWVSERMHASFDLSNRGGSGQGAEFTMRFSK